MPAAAPAGGAEPGAASSPAGPEGGDAPLRLPEMGTAAEILASLRSPGGAAVPPADPSGATQPQRIYTFADALAGGGGGEAPAPAVQRESWVVFELAGEHYGLPVAAVREILRVGTITRVPHTPAPVRGIANLRGRILAVVDLRVRLALPPAEIGPRSRILVVDSRHRTLGLLVDAALQVVKLAPGEIEPPPADVMTARSAYILGVHHLDEQMIIALDLDRVLLVHEGDLAAVPAPPPVAPTSPPTPPSAPSPPSPPAPTSPPAHPSPPAPGGEPGPAGATRAPGTGS
jgi:purine-binding chemotaxis protein CheW